MSEHSHEELRESGTFTYKGRVPCEHAANGEHTMQVTVTVDEQGHVTIRLEDERGRFLQVACPVPDNSQNGLPVMGLAEGDLDPEMVQGVLQDALGRLHAPVMVVHAFINSFDRRILINKERAQ